MSSVSTSVRLVYVLSVPVQAVEWRWRTSRALCRPPRAPPEQKTSGHLGPRARVRPEARDGVRSTHQNPRSWYFRPFSNASLRFVFRSVLTAVEVKRNAYADRDETFYEGCIIMK